MDVVSIRLVTPPASVPPMTNGRLAHDGQPARVEAITPGGDVMPLAITLGLLTGPDSAPTGTVAVLRSADATLVQFGSPGAE